MVPNQNNQYDVGEACQVNFQPEGLVDVVGLVLEKTQSPWGNTYVIYFWCPMYKRWRHEAYHASHLRKIH